MDYKLIKLTRGKEALVDAEDFERINKFKWFAHFDGWNYYAVRWSPFKDGKRQTIRMHRVITECHDKTKEIDHINGNGIDNRKSNLRICTHHQNLYNKRKKKIGIMGITSKGVTYDRRTGKYIGQIRRNGIKYAKQCNNEKEAANWFLKKEAEIMAGALST